MTKSFVYKMCIYFKKSVLKYIKCIIYCTGDKNQAQDPKSKVLKVEWKAVTTITLDNTTIHTISFWTFDYFGIEIKLII